MDHTLNNEWMTFIFRGLQRLSRKRGDRTMSRVILVGVANREDEGALWQWVPTQILPRPLF